MTQFLRQQGFLAAIAVAIAAAFVYPEAGANGGWLKGETTTKAAVAAIFLLQGLSLPSELMRQSVRRFRLHGFAQAWIYLGAPLVVLGLYAVAGRGIHPDLAKGFLFLAALPTTITSAVYFTASADGDVPGAVFNCCAANLASVFVTPAWCALTLLPLAQDGLSLTDVFLKLSALILAPMAVGQALRPRLIARLDRVRRHFGKITASMILLIIYCSFSNSVANASWTRLGLGALAQSLLIAAGLLALISWLVWRTSGWRAWGFDRRARVAAFYCGSQKSLATGAPIAASLFGASPAGSGLDAGVMIVPLMCYHVFQLILAGVLAPRLR